MDKSELKKFVGLIGCDEVGRGPIAGPVNACAVRIESSKLVDELLAINVTDSKKLTEKKRKKILKLLGIDIDKLELNRVYKINYAGEKIGFCIAEHSPEEIDNMNILKASLSAMKNASEKLINTGDKILVDGNKIFSSETVIEAVVKGDSKSTAIGLASIIAKVFRDEKMKEYDRKFPGYGLANHAGYPTKEHKFAVEKLGPTPIHRKTFKGVKEFCLAD